jgi:ABC-type microcin C transport system duplicated ATPase subunit YejF
LNAPPLLEARDLRVSFTQRGWLSKATEVQALRGVSFVLSEGQSLAIVGESGSGKSTLVRALLRLQTLVAGQVLLRGVDLAILTAEELRQQRRAMQLVFQDPIASLDPRMDVATIVEQPMLAYTSNMDAAQRRRRVVAQLQTVGLDEQFLPRRPRELSGGQAQRVGIARALIADPALLMCDEPVSALDLSLRSQVLDLLLAERAKRNLALLLVTHDLSAARFLCEHTMVLYRGQVVEQGLTRELFARPQHAYTQQLLAAQLTVNPEAAKQRLSAR